LTPFRKKFSVHVYCGNHLINPAKKYPFKGGGTTFTFTVRFAFSDEGDEMFSSTQKIELEEKVEDLPRLQILVVDDITPNRDLTRMILEQGQHETLM